MTDILLVLILAVLLAQYVETPGGRGLLKSILRRLRK